MLVNPATNLDRATNPETKRDKAINRADKMANVVKVTNPVAKGVSAARAPNPVIRLAKAISPATSQGRAVRAVDKLANVVRATKQVASAVRVIAPEVVNAVARAISPAATKVVRERSPETIIREIPMTFFCKQRLTMAQALQPGRLARVASALAAATGKAEHKRVVALGLVAPTPTHSPMAAVDPEMFTINWPSN